MPILKKIMDLVKEDNHKRSFKQAFSITLMGNLFLQGVGIVSGILSARILGPQGRGDLAVVFFYPTFVALLGIVGLNQAVAYEVSQRKDLEPTIMRAGFCVAIGLGLLQIIAFVALVPLFLPADKEHLTIIVRLFMSYVLIYFLSQTLLAVDQGAFRFKRYILILVLPSVAYVAGILLSWVWGIADVLTFTVACLGSHALIVFVRIFLSGKELFGDYPSFSESLNLLKRGLRLCLPYVGGIIMSRIDMAIVVTRFPAEQIGLYVVALAIGLGQLGVISAFIQVSFVKIAGEKENKAALNTFLIQFRMAQFIILCVAICFVIMAPYLVRYFFGEAFMEALSTGYWLIFAMGAMGLTNILENGLKAIDQAWIAGVGYIAGGIIALIGGIYWVRPGEIEKLGGVMLLAYVIIIIFDLYLLSNRRGVKLKDLWGLSPSIINKIIREKHL